MLELTMQAKKKKGALSQILRFCPPYRYESNSGDEPVIKMRVWAPGNAHCNSCTNTDRLATEKDGYKDERKKDENSTRKAFGSDMPDSR